MEDILAILLIFGGGTLFLLAVSPVGRAVADRIRGAGPAGQAVQELRDTQLALLDEVDRLRQEVTDVQERMDFAERLLAQQREANRLPGVEERQRGPAHS